MNTKILFIIFLIIAFGCREIYNPPVSSPDTGYLVVEGFINSTGITTIKLSRTAKLSKGDTIEYEYRASVSIESDNNESFLLNEKDSGIYVSDELLLNPNEKYRLHIRRSNGKEYVSDYSLYRTTPVIDSITWQREDGVHIYVNSHDPQNNTKYYHWEYEETWEYHSAFRSTLKYDYEYGTTLPLRVAWRDSLRHSADTTIYKCWKTVHSTNILVGSSVKLRSDVIYLPLYIIPPASEQLSVLYSVYLSQCAISKENYEFLQKMKKNTEQLDSIFDAQPTELKGNIHSTSNPDEIVVGFIDVSQQQNKRIFISNAEVPDWNYDPNCFQAKIHNDFIHIRSEGTGLIPTVPSATSANPLEEISYFFAALPQCVDCTYGGRTNVKPDFWP